MVSTQRGLQETMQVTHLWKAQRLGYPENGALLSVVGLVTENKRSKSTIYVDKCVVCVRTRWRLALLARILY